MHEQNDNKISHTSLVLKYFPNATVDEVSHILNHHTTFLTSPIEVVEDEILQYIIELKNNRTREKELENKMKGR